MGSVDLHAGLHTFETNTLPTGPFPMVGLLLAEDDPDFLIVLSLDAGVTDGQQTS